MARADAFAAFEHIRQAAPHYAEQWLVGLFDAIASLEEMPTRCPIIPEADEFHRPLRHLLYGKRSGIYRVIFDIQESSEEGPQVRILRIWHGACDRIKQEDVSP